MLFLVGKKGCGEGQAEGGSAWGGCCEAGSGAGSWGSGVCEEGPCVCLRICDVDPHFTQGLSQDAAVLAAFALLPRWCFPCPLLIKCAGLNAGLLVC